MLIASSIGQIAHPFFIVFARLLAAYYSLIPNYAVAIALLTLTVMVVVFPITRRATRSMMKMQLLAPELKALQAKYKAKPGMPVQERQELRQHLNEEMMALYKENNVSPTGGCLPIILQLPAFWILYGTIKGLIHTTGKGVHLLANPLYLSHSSRMYSDITHAKVGHLDAFGLNLADSVRTTNLTWGSKVPYIALILVAIGLQYIQMRQLNGRNPAAAQANPQMQQMQKIFPIVFGVIYIAIPAGVNVYFIVSNLFRIGQQEFMYRRDPHIKASVERLRARTKTGPKPAGLAAGKIVETTVVPEKPKPKPSTNGRRTPRSSNGSRPVSSKTQPRAQGKRARRPR